MGTNEQEEDAAKQPRQMTGAALIAAIVVLLAFATFVAYLIGQVGTTEVRWTRLAWLFASVEAIAFGAAGALFGTTIQRKRVERAEAKAAENADAAANGKALAATLKASAESAPAFEALGESASAADLARHHADIARTLFP